MSLGVSGRGQCTKSWNPSVTFPADPDYWVCIFLKHLVPTFTTAPVCPDLGFRTAGTAPTRAEGSFRVNTRVSREPDDEGPG